MGLRRWEALVKIQGELTEAEIMVHGAAIAAAQTEEAFVAAFAAYARDVLARESEPHEKIGHFVHGLLEGSRAMMGLLRSRGGGSA